MVEDLRKYYHRLKGVEYNLHIGNYHICNVFLVTVYFWHKINGTLPLGETHNIDGLILKYFHSCHI